MKQADAQQNAWWVGLMLVVLAVSPYWQTRSHDFVNYDDSYLTENLVILQGVTWQAARWSFTAFEGGHWQPLTWLSHMVACDLFRGKDGSQWPGGHHLMNVALHAINTLLLWFVLWRMTASFWRSALVAALFAVHPLHVESVAWVTERRDMLSTLFGLAAIGIYSVYARRGGVAAYLGTFACFLLSLMSKPMLVTLPALLLLLDIWPLQRWSPFGAGAPSAPTSPASRPGVGRILLEKVPMVLVSMAFSKVALLASVGSLPSLEEMSVGDRLNNVTVAYGLYLWRMVLPTDLAVFYPWQRWESWQVLAAGSTLAVISILALVLRRRAPWILVGWLWYLGLLVPVIGLVQVGLQSMADRYTYLSAVGVFIMVAWSIPGSLTGRALIPWVAAAGAAVLILMSMAYKQASYWRDSRSLFNRAQAVTRNNYMAHQNLGNALEKEGKLDLAMEHYVRAMAIRPNYGKIHENVANVLIQWGRFPEAIEQIEWAIRLTPESFTAYNSLGVIMLASQKWPEAEIAFRHAVELGSTNLEARGNHGLALLKTGKFAEAVEELKVVKQALPQRYGVRANLALALAGCGRPEQALAELRDILAAKPDFPPAQAALKQIQQSTTAPSASQPESLSR